MKELERLALGRHDVTYYRDALNAAQQADHRRRDMLQSLIPAEEQPWEESPQGLIKHMVNDAMDTAEQSLDMYQQVIAPGGRSGRHRHFSEEILFVVEGSGYDLHWDPIFAADRVYEWKWEDEPKRFEWEAGDYIYVPPYAIHQHVAGPEGRARLLSATSRVVKFMGFDGLEQLEEASPTTGIVL